MLKLLRKIFTITNEGNYKTIVICGIRFKTKKENLFEGLKPLFAILDTFLPKKQNKIVFNSNPDYSDNTKYYYEYIKNNYSKEYELIWITLQKPKNIKNSPKNCYPLFSLKGIWHIITAQYIVLNTINIFVEYIFSTKHTIINLWHGMPIKTIGMAEKNPSKRHLKRYQFLAKNSYMFTTSDIFKNIMVASFASDFKKTFITGQPRTDCIFNNKKAPNFKQYFELDKFDKIILYTPTYKEWVRGGKREVQQKFNNIFYLNDFDEKSFLDTLEKNNILFIIKPHMANENFYRKKVSKMDFVQNKHIKIIYNKTLEEQDLYLYEMFPLVDLMISDFSSITIDFLITRKPVVYLSNLTTEYNNGRGLMLEDNSEILTHGTFVNSYAELEQTIIQPPQSNDQQAYKLLHKYIDGNSSERIYKIMTQLH